MINEKIRVDMLKIANFVSMMFDKLSFVYKPSYNTLRIGIRTYIKTNIYLIIV